MKKYIDADLLKEKLGRFIDGADQNYTAYKCGYDDCLTAIQDTISDMLATDVAEVVRCMDCKYWFNGDCHCEEWENNHNYQITKSNDFCSYGEKGGDNV